MARRRASMREGPLAELFRATEAAQRQAEREAAGETSPQTPEESAPVEPHEETVEHVPTFERSAPRPRRHGHATPGDARAGARARAPPLAAVPERAERGRATSRRSRVRAAARARTSPAPRAADRLRGVPRSHPRRRRRRRRAERDPPDDGRRDQPGRVRRGQHRPAAAADVGRRGEAPHRPRPDEGPRLRADPRIGQPRSGGVADQIKHALRGSDMVFVTAGEGGGTGSGAAPSSRGSRASSAR